MKTYKNKKTGIVILSDSELSGDWEVVSTKASKKSTKKVDEKEDEE